MGTMIKKAVVAYVIAFLILVILCLLAFGNTVRTGDTLMGGIVLTVIFFFAMVLLTAIGLDE